MTQDERWLAKYNEIMLEVAIIEIATSCGNV